MGDVMCEPMKLPPLMERFFRYARDNDALLWIDSCLFKGCEPEVHDALWYGKFYKEVINSKCSTELKNQIALTYITALRKLEVMDKKRETL